MVKSVKIVLVGFFMFACASSASAMTVEAVSESSGVYEGGKFTPREDSFHAIYSIRKDENRIVLEEVIASDREGRAQSGLSYEIMGEMQSEGFSAISVSPSRKGQKIYTAVREGHLGSLEILVIGENFYEYSSITGGQFYLESGRIKKQ